jgi:hypothetical protein
MPIPPCPVFVAGDEGDRGGEFAVAQGDAGIGRRRNGRRDAGTIEGDAGFTSTSLLRPVRTRTDRRPSARDELVFPGRGHDQGVDLILGGGVVAAFSPT